MNTLSVTITKRERIWGLCYIPIQLLVLPFLIIQGNLLAGNPFTASQVNFILFCTDFLCVTVIFHRFLFQSLKRALASPWRVLRFAGAGLLLYWIGSFVVSTIIVSVNPEFINVNDASMTELVQDNFALIAFGTVLLVPITEETLFRGLVFSSIYKRSKLGAFVISSAIFASLHVIGYIGLYQPLHLLLCFIQYIPAGLCLAWAYVKADTIFAPILMHIAINQMGVLAMR